MMSEDRKLLKDISKFFSTADADGSGSLSIMEFYEYQKQQASRTRELDDTRLARIEKKVDQIAEALLVLTKVVQEHV